MFCQFGDVGSTYVLEATIVAVLMVSSIAFVATVETDPGLNQSAHLLEARAKNFLAVLNAFPMSSECDGHTLLERLIIEGVNGQNQAWEKQVSKRLPPGTEAELFLDNGRALYPLQSSRGFKGTTAAVQIQPDFTFVSAITEVEVADGQTRWISDSFAVHQAQSVRTKGEALKYTISLGSKPGHTATSGWAVTALDGNILRESNLLNLSWMDFGSQPILTQSLRPSDLSPVSAGKTFSLMIAGSRMSEGVELHVSIPSDWEFLAAEGSAWQIKSKNSRGLHFTATSAAAYSNSLDVRLRPPSNPIHPFDVLHARLGNGSLGESSLVVTYPTSVERSLPRAVYPTVPYPLRPGSRALFGVAFANGGEKTVVTQVDVEIPGGYDVWRNEGRGAELFAEADVLRPSDQDGAWSWVDARHLRWEGERVVEALGASSWALGVLVTDDVGEATSVEPARSDGPEGRLRFGNGFEHRSTRWGPVPGVVRHDVPPASGPDASDGYPWATADAGAVASGGPVTEHAVEVRSVAASLAGRGDYEVSPAAGDLLRLRSSLANSSFVVRERMVPVGGVLQSDADFESVVNELGKMGVADTSLTMELYAPPSRGCEPTAAWSRDSRSLPLARVRDVALWDPLGVGQSDLFLVAEDGQAYRVNAAGSPLWSVPLGAKGVRLLAAEYGPADRRLFAASEDGAVHRLDPATGAVVWSAQAAQGWGTLDGVSALAAQPSLDRVLVGTSLGAVVALDAATGARVPVPREDAASASPAAAPEGDGAVLRVEVAQADGARSAGSATSAASAGGTVPEAVFVAHGRVVRVLAASDLSVLAERRVEGGGDVVGFAVAPGRVLVATPGRTLVLALPDLSPQGDGVAHPSGAVLAEAGDATGDGVQDLVVALKDRGLVAVSGASGGVAWSRVEDPWVDLMPREVPFGALDPWRATRKGHVCEKVAATYQSASVACAWSSRRDQSEPLMLRVGAERTYYARLDRGNPMLDALDQSGQRVAQKVLEQVPEAMAAGPWALEEAVAVAGTEGTVDVYRGEGSEWRRPALSVRPTDFVGRFTFFTPVPGGGFFGTHLLVATLSWTEGGGGEGAGAGVEGEAVAGRVRQARLFDWFEVVGPDGRPVLEPSYRVVLVVQDRGDPLER